MVSPILIPGSAGEGRISELIAARLVKYFI
jgi:hypothetical protein